MKKRKKSLVISLGAVFLLAVAGGAGVAYFVSNQPKTATVQTSPAAPKVQSPTKDKVTTYYGVKDKTALELLQKYTVVKMTGTGESAFVTSIDGVAADKTNYWSFNVNGVPATVGAGSYVTKTTDKITWTLEKI